MVATRVIPSTLVPRTRGVIAEVRRALAELERLPASKRLLEDVEALQQFLASDTLHLDVVVVSPLGDAAQAESVARWISPGLSGDPLLRCDEPATITIPGDSEATSIHLNIFPADDPRSRRAAEPRPSVLVCVSGGSGPLDPRLGETLEALCEDRPYAVLIVSSDADSLESLQNSVRDAWFSEFIALQANEGLDSVSLVERLRTPAWKEIEELLRSHAALQALRSATDAVRLLLDQEERDSRVRRAVTQQRAAQLQQSGAPNPTVLQAEIRSLLQQHFADFEAGVIDRLSQMFSPKSGALSTQIETHLAELTDLHREDKSRTTALTIPDQYRAHLLRSIGRSIRGHCLADLKAMRDLFRLVQAELEERLRAAEAAVVPLQFTFLSQDRLERVLDAAIRIDKPYRGEVPRRGFGEFLSFVRRSVFSLLGISSLLALLIGSGRMDVLKASLRPWRDTLGIVVAVGFTLFAYRSIVGEREDARLRELEKARESVRAELRRMMSEVERAWSAIVSDHLREQLAVAQRQLEEALRLAQARQSDEVAEDKRRLQRQLQSLEASERHVATIAKLREGQAKEIASLLGEARQAFFGALGPLRGKAT